MEALGQLCWDIFHGVYSDICNALHETMFQFLDKETLATDFRQWCIQYHVAPGDHLHKFDPEAWANGF